MQRLARWRVFSDCRLREGCLVFGQFCAAGCSSWCSCPLYYVCLFDGGGFAYRLVEEMDFFLTFCFRCCEY